MNPYQILGISLVPVMMKSKRLIVPFLKNIIQTLILEILIKQNIQKNLKKSKMRIKPLWMKEKEGFKQQSYGNQTAGTGGYQYQGNDQEAYQEANGFIQGRRYQEALNVLNQIQNKTSMWFYLAAIAENGLGNNIRAQEYAQTALQMEPMNMQYILLLNQLQGNSRQYRQTSQQYGNPASMMNCCYSVLLLNCMMSCCCGGGYHYPILCC